MASPDRQISRTDPDARAMVSAGTGTGVVGYNLQAAVDATTHIVVAHEVINLGHDRTSLATMGRQAEEATGAETMTVLADRGYFSGPEVLACKEVGVVPICPKPLTSTETKAHHGRLPLGRFGPLPIASVNGSTWWQADIWSGRLACKVRWATDHECDGSPMMDSASLTSACIHASPADATTSGSSEIDFPKCWTGGP